jgi:hypothetical protein
MLTIFLCIVISKIPHDTDDYFEDEKPRIVFMTFITLNIIESI